jgi:site-specific recombinase XerD
MINSLFSWKKIRTRLRSGPAAPFLEDLASFLQQQQYRTLTVCQYVKAADAFSRWLKRNGYSINEINNVIAESYISKFRRRRCPNRASGFLPAAAYGVRKFLEFLRNRGVIPSQSEAMLDPAFQWLNPFSIHLDRLGLAAGTRQMYLRFARNLLKDSFGTSIPAGQQLTADCIRKFVRREAARLKPSSCRAPVAATRVFLRYLIMNGLIPIGLDSAVPTIRQWKLASLPKYLSQEEVALVFAGCQATAVGRRDRAILTLLNCLGLRAGEVAQLQLENINWREGSIRIRSSKSGRERTLPLPQEAGVALIAYLKNGRPQSNNHAVFLKCRPPYRALKGSSSISAIATNYIKRAGISAHRGAHVFRHTAATQMVCKGATFKDVADVLGHQRLITTAIYAKLDMEKLASVALPWPGGEQ